MTVGYSEMGTRVGTVGYGRAAPQTGFTSCQIGDIGGYSSVCVLTLEHSVSFVLSCCHRSRQA